MKEPKKLRCLIACEESQIVTKAFRELGHEAYSCDLQYPSGGHPEWHIMHDAVEVAYSGSWDLMIAHPPCQKLSKAGGANWKRPGFKEAQAQAFKFVIALWNAPIPSICIENPIGWLNSNWKKPKQRVHPYHFGDPWTKETCFWLKSLRPLMPTEIVKPIGNWVKPGNVRPHRKFYSVPEGANGSPKNRSKTFPGIARAMAEQWGGIVF